MRILITFCLFIVMGCHETPKHLPAGLEYYPDLELMQEGLVFKFYNHRGNTGTQTKTDIVYRKMVLKDSKIISEDFDAAFQKSYYTEYQIEGSQWKMMVSKSYSYRNTKTALFKENTYIIENDVAIDWEENEATLNRKVVLEGYGNRIVNKQLENIDSLAEGKKIKIIKGHREFNSFNDEKEQEPVGFRTLRHYEEGFGMTKSILENNATKYEMVLDEIMTLKEFERRVNHGTHRVAYIDTLETIDDHTLFKPCYHQSKINDYYNDERSGFKGGKGRLRALLKEKLDPSHLEGQSGYLTFRFVVNCNSEAGWFVTEEAGLDYEKKQFSEACRMNLYEILKAEKEWKNLTIRNEARDAYTYITFKIKNGEIIELLP